MVIERTSKEIIEKLNIQTRRDGERTGQGGFAHRWVVLEKFRVEFSTMRNEFWKFTEGC